MSVDPSIPVELNVERDCKRLWGTDDPELEPDTEDPLCGFKADDSVERNETEEGEGEDTDVEPVRTEIKSGCWSHPSVI